MIFPSLYHVSGYLHWAYHCLVQLISWSHVVYFSCWKGIARGLKCECCLCPNLMLSYRLFTACHIYSLNSVIDSIVLYAFEINLLTRFVNCRNSLLLRLTTAWQCCDCRVNDMRPFIFQYLFVAKANAIATPVGYFGQQLNFPGSSLRDRTTWVCFGTKLSNHFFLTLDLLW